jgi:hypothetical protein
MTDNVARGRVVEVTFREAEPQAGPYQVIRVNGKTLAMDIYRRLDADPVPGTLGWVTSEVHALLESCKFCPE